MTLVIHSDHDHLCATSTSVYQIYTAIFVVKKMHSDIFTNTNTSKWMKTKKNTIFVLEKNITIEMIKCYINNLAVSRNNFQSEDSCLGFFFLSILYCAAMIHLNRFLKDI